MTGAQARNHEDGTLTLLQVGSGVFLTGALALLLTLTVLGGADRHGPHNSAAWLGFILALLCLPLGIIMLILGGAKWLRNRLTAR